MGLILGVGELMLFAVFDAVCVMLALTLIFAPLSMILTLVGLQLDDVDEQTITGATMGTMIIWALMLAAGAICSATGHTVLSNVSPFRWVQEVLQTSLQPHLRPAPHSWATDYSGMWATFWSYCIVSLLCALLVMIAALCCSARSASGCDARI